jgi:hypothetical protein
MSGEPTPDPLPQPKDADPADSQRLDASRSEIDRDEIDRAEVLAAVDAVADAPGFGRGSRLAELLRFIVTEELEGHGDRLKAYAIATQVLGRRSGFDPGTDSIVRVEMARLRTALKVHYADHPGGVVIDIPKGRYRPMFSRAARPDERGDAPPEPSAPVPAAELPRRRSSTRASVWILFLALNAAAILAAYLGLIEGRQQSPSGEPPLVLVAPVTVTSRDAQAVALGPALQSLLVSEIAFDPLLSVAFAGDAAASRPIRSDDGRAIYSLTVAILAEGDRWTISAVLEDARTKTVAWSYAQDGTSGATEGLQLLQTMSRRLAAAILDPFGFVARVELARPAEGQLAERQCVLWLRQYLTTWTESGLNRFIDCAKRLENDPKSRGATAFALMARGNYKALRWLGVPDRTQRLATAAREIESAKAINPYQELVETTAIRIAACLDDEATVERLLKAFVERRPNNPVAMFDAAFLSAFVLGDITMADQLTQRGRRLAVTDQPTENLPPALAAFLRGDMREVLRLLGRSVVPSHPVNNVLQLVSSAAQDDAATFRAAIRRLAESGFRTPESIEGIVMNSCWDDEIKAEIGNALRSSLAVGRSWWRPL